jgi:signal transduction histidine kinase/CheY-like chemotaxis protein/integral membrane sensor domain MASE1
MKKRDFIFALNCILSVLSVAFAAQIAVIVADPQFSGHINQIAPVFGVAFGIVWLGGMRYLPAVFIGALLPALFAEENLLMILSVPIATVTASALSLRILESLHVRFNMERIRDALLILFMGIILSTCFGAVVESVFQCRSTGGIHWNDFKALFLTNWLAAAVGSIIITPFILTWADRSGFKLVGRQFIEVGLWLIVLSAFGLVTFQNWAPTDVLFYPMELAIFPIMAWSAIRFGLRGASAGVFVLALLAVWSLIPIFSAESTSISQSPTNVWIFVGIVSITSICLAAVMTELRHREAQISENERRLSAFTGALPDIAFVFSREGMIVDVFSANFAVMSTHRITNTERVIGKPLAAVFDANACRDFLATISESLDSNSVETLEYCLESVDVGEHWFEARVSPMSTGEQQADCVVWVAYNISTRKAAEAAIKQRDVVLNATARANHALLTTVDFDNAIDLAMREVGIAMNIERSFVFEITGGSSESYHTFNPRFEWLKNDSYQSILEHRSLQDAPFEDFFPGWYEELMQGGIIQTIGATDGHLDSKVFQELESESLLVIPMWIGGRLYGFFAMDYCSEQHQWNECEIDAARVLASSIGGLILMQEREEELRIARDQSDSASVAKGEFLAMMSHEIRTPMNAIIGYTDLMFQTNLDDVQSEQASIIKRSGKALMNLINNILDYSKIETHKMLLESIEFDLEQIMCEALEYVLPDAKEKKLQIDYELGDGVSEIYMGDPHRIRQILMNLTSNAVKFTNEGCVLMSVSLDQAKSIDGIDMLHFEVQDSGCGIAKDKFDQLFKAFTQVDSSTTRKFGGTGLGLVICKRLVERMNGEIWVESAVNAGSCFQFTIPLPRLKQLNVNYPASVVRKEMGSEYAEQIQADFAHEHPLRLLICEDDEDNRWVIKSLLELLGYEPQVAQDGVQAIELMNREVFDVILMDVRLPGQSGIEFTQAIRSGKFKQQDAQQYIIAVTAFAMNEDRTKCLAAGMNDYLSKPVEVAKLKDALIRAHRALIS